MCVYVCVASMREYGVNVDKIFIHVQRCCIHTRQQPHVTAITISERVHAYLKDVVIVIYTLTTHDKYFEK